jgi:hypothetical protein
MKLAKTYFDSGATAAVERQTSTGRGKNRVELDDELFLPVAARASGDDRAAANRLAAHSAASDRPSRSSSPRRSAGTSLPAIAAPPRKNQRPQRLPPRAELATSEPYANSDHFQQPDPAVDADGRRWPTLSPAPPDLKKELENKIKELSEELTQRYAQIADLCNVRHQQDSELQEARNMIDSIDNTISMLKGEIEKHASDASAARQELARSNRENATLRMELENKKCESAALLKRSLKVDVAFNDREVTIASARETVEFLRRDVAAKAAEASNLRATIKEVNRRHRDELNQKDMQFRIQIKKFEVMLSERDMQLKALDKVHSKLVERYNSLASNMDALEGTDRIAGEKTKSQNELVELLETLLRAERESAEIKIRELTEELQRERSERSAENSSSAAAQQDNVLLSPKFAGRRSRFYEDEFDSSMSKTDAA